LIRTLHPLSVSLAVLLLAASSAHAATPTVAEVEKQFRSGDKAQALARADAALQADGNLAGMRFLKGVMLTESGRTDEARGVFERMTQDFPEMPEPYNNLAVLEAAAGRLDQARALLDTALRHDPAYRTAHENLGDVLVRLAQRAYEASAQGARAEADLQRKLRLVRDLTASR
jgi:Flp pilus assembly protein TadD